MSDLRKKLHDRIELALTIADGPVDRRELVHAAIDEIVTEEEGAFDLRWDADMRAIKRWQEAHPGKELVWPDHADLVVWLLEQQDAMTEAVPEMVAVAITGLPNGGGVTYNEARTIGDKVLLAILGEPHDA